MTIGVTTLPRKYSVDASSEVEALIDWYVVNHINPYVNDNLPIQVDVSYNRSLKVDGEVEQVFIDYYVIHLKPNKDRDYLINTVCHELIHVKQYRLEEMVEDEYDGCLVTFNGVAYNKEEMNYQDYPWEVEAWNNESVVYNDWHSASESNSFYL